MQNSEPGLRERKRAETRDKLEKAAVTLVLKNGLEHATIDAICEAADVSSRTFFNYFDNKEDAVLGLQDSEITDDAVAAVLAGHAGADPVELTIRLMFGVLNPSINSSTLFKSRMKIVKQHPQLLGRMAGQMQRMTEQLTTAIRPILGDAPGFADENATETELSVEVMLSLCSGATRAAVKEWAANGNQAPLEAVEERAIELVRNTVKRIK
jgi:AcrR family transcriptional regulator